MKLICYSLFAGNAERFEKMAYLRGFYWNSRMNSFIYPDWRTHLEIDRALYTAYQRLFDWLVENNCLDLHVNEVTPPLCEGMLWRMKPMFTIDISHILCRDSDAITTYREAYTVQKWLESGLVCHQINDNPSHSGLMGGMIGLDTAKIKALLGLHSFEQLIQGRDLSQRGSDQHLLNQVVGPAVVGSTFLSNESNIPGVMAQYPIPGVHPKFWVSNLTCRHIGSAGVVDFEMIRFFKINDEYQWKFDVIEKEFPQIFYWHL